MGNLIYKNGNIKILRISKNVFHVVDEDNKPKAFIEFHENYNNSIKYIKDIDGKSIPDIKYIPTIVLWIVENSFDIIWCKDFLHFPSELDINGEKYELITQNLTNT